MVKFRAVEVFANRYVDSRVLSGGIKTLGFSSRDFVIDVWPPPLGHVDLPRGAC